MRYVVWVVLGLAASTTAASAQSPWAERLFTEETHTSLTHDFGSVPRGTVLHHQFKMVNIYAVPLEINVRVGCHCVTAAASKPVLGKRETGYIDIEMHTDRFSGPRTVNIYVTTGPQFVSTATLQVTANSRGDIVLNPGQITLGVVQGGQKSPPQTLDIEYAGVLDWRINEIVNSGAPLDVTYQQLYRRPGQVGYRLSVALKPDAPAGSLRQELYVKTSDPASPILPILVEGTVQASLSAAPNPLSFQTLKIGESATKLVLVRSTSKAFRITGVDNLTDGVSAELPTGPAKMVQALKIKCQPTKDGSLHCELKVKTDLGDEVSIPVTVEANVQP